MHVLKKALTKYDDTKLCIFDRFYKEESILIDLCKTRNSKLLFFQKTEENVNTTIKIFNDGTYETDDVELANFRKEQALM